jgi:hypothetical protein
MVRANRDSSTKGAPNVVVESLTFVLRIREVQSSNLGPETVYPDLRFLGFSQSFQVNTEIVP